MRAGARGYGYQVVPVVWRAAWVGTRGYLPQKKIISFDQTAPRFRRLQQRANGCAIHLPLCHPHKSVRESKADEANYKATVRRPKTSLLNGRRARQTATSSNMRSLAGRRRSAGCQRGLLHRTTAASLLSPVVPCFPSCGCRSFDRRRARSSGAAARCRRHDCRSLLCRQYGTRAVPTQNPPGTHVYYPPARSAPGTGGRVLVYPVPTRYPVHVYRHGSQALPPSPSCFSFLLHRFALGSFTD